jgi:enolase
MNIIDKNEKIRIELNKISNELFTKLKKFDESLKENEILREKLKEEQLINTDITNENKKMVGIIIEQKQTIVIKENIIFELKETNEEINKTHSNQIEDIKSKNDLNLKENCLNELNMYNNTLQIRHDQLENQYREYDQNSCAQIDSLKNKI